MNRKGPDAGLGHREELGRAYAGCRAIRPGVLEPPQNPRGPGWYDTGDIAAIDDTRFVVIQGRAKRFGQGRRGNGVELALVEQLAEHAWPKTRHAALSIPEERKGSSSSC